MRRALLIAMASSVGLFGACASGGWPGEERVGGNREFDPGDPMPQAAQEEKKPAAQAAPKPAPSGKFTKAGASSYVRPTSKYPSLSELYRRKQQTCSGGKAPPSSILAKGDVKLETATGTLVGTASLYYEAPDKLTQRMDVAEDREAIAYGEGEVLRQGYDGQRGWQSDKKGGAFFLDDSLSHLLELEVKGLFADWGQIYSEARGTSEQELNATPVYVVEATSRLGEKLKLYVHRDTGVLVRFEHLDPVDPKTVLSTVDYVDVGVRDGFCFPSRISVRSSEDRRDVQIKSVTKNPAKAPSTKRPKELEGVGDL